MARLCCAWLVIGSLAATVVEAGQPPLGSQLQESIACESARLAAESAVPAAPRQSPAVDDQWRRLGRVPAGREVRVVTGRDLAAPRIFVAADNTGLIVLNLTSPKLTPTARRVLTDLAASHPDVFLEAANTYENQLTGITLSSLGLFVDSRLVEERSLLIQRIQRGELRELRLGGPSGSHWRLGAFIGAAAGALIWYGLASRCGPGGVPEECSGYALMTAPLGAAIGAGAGAAVGAAADRPASRPIYMVP